jgi:hypothetical protein
MNMGGNTRRLPPSLREFDAIDEKAIEVSITWLLPLIATIRGEKQLIFLSSIRTLYVKGHLSHFWREVPFYVVPVPEQHERHRFSICLGT